MEAFKSLEPFVVSLFWTPVALAMGIMSAGAGHGSYTIAKILFPYTMLSTVRNESITLGWMLFAVVQYPIYGLIVSAARNRKAGLLALTIFHSLCVILAFIDVSQVFS
jgi:hypothetical protein